MKNNENNTEIEQEEEIYTNLRLAPNMSIFTAEEINNLFPQGIEGKILHTFSLEFPNGEREGLCHIKLNKPLSDGRTTILTYKSNLKIFNPTNSTSPTASQLFEQLGYSRIIAQDDSNGRYLAYKNKDYRIEFDFARQCYTKYLKMNYHNSVIRVSMPELKAIIKAFEERGVDFDDLGNRG